MHAALNLLLQTRRARFAAKQAYAQRGGSPVVSHALSHLADMKSVSRRGNQDGSAIILDHLDLALGIARSSRNHHASKLLQAVVQAKTASEHAVTERHLHAVGGHDTCHLGQTRDAVTPNVHVVIVVANDDGLTRSSRGSVQLNDLVKRHSEQTVRERVSQR